jgi:crossover junction endodeoxyribonuclease RuvC
MLTAAEAEIDIHEYTPLQIKQTISGYGKADKKLIEKLIQSSLDICTRIKPDDSSDALAIALCHYHHLINV